MKSTQCQKIKNPCKYCRQAVNKKNGLQCQGACKKWAHFKCLDFTPGKISDVKAGIIEVKCPCSDCDTTMPKEVLTKPPYICAKQKCPAYKLPMCDSTECPSKGITKTPHRCQPKPCSHTPSCTPLSTYLPQSGHPQSCPPRTCPSTPCSATPCSATPCSPTPCSLTPRTPRSCSPTPCPSTPCSAQICPTQHCPLQSNEPTHLESCCRTPSPPKYSSLASCSYKPCPLLPCPVQHCPVQHCPMKQCPLHQCPLQHCPFQQCPLQQCTKQPCSGMLGPEQHCSKPPCSPHPCPARPCPQTHSPLPCILPKCTKSQSSGFANSTPIILTPLPICPVTSQRHGSQKAPLHESENQVTAFLTSEKSPSSSLLSSDDSGKGLYDTSSLDSNLEAEQSSMSGTLKDVNYTLDKLTTQMKNLTEKMAKN